MSINGIYGDHSHLFSPEQWVNVYVRDFSNRAIYYSTMQVKHLINLEADALEDFLLEPITEDDQLMTVAEAKQCCQ